MGKVSDILGGVGRIAVRSFYPQICPVCDRVLDGDLYGLYSGDVKSRGICKKCEKALVYPKNVCEKCGRAVSDKIGRISDETQGMHTFCEACQNSERKFEEGKVLWKYEGDIRGMLHRMKYDDRRDIAEFIGRRMGESFALWIGEKAFDAIIPVPMHHSRERKRGYNQAQIIAGQLSAQTNVPVYGDIAFRILRTKPLKDMSAAERKNNLKNAFKIRKNVVQFKSVLLVDDIYTTGSTIEALAVEIKKAGVADHICFVAAAAREEI